jgi:hypothetical protein
LFEVAFGTVLFEFAFGCTSTSSNLPLLPPETKPKQSIRATQPPTIITHIIHVIPNAALFFTSSAGNASGISDGAGAIVLASESASSKHNLKPIARVLGYHISGQRHRHASHTSANLCRSQALTQQSWVTAPFPPSEVSSRAQASLWIRSALFSAEETAF